MSLYKATESPLYKALNSYTRGSTGRQRGTPLFRSFFTQHLCHDDCVCVCLQSSPDCSAPCLLDISMQHSTGSSASPVPNEVHHPVPQVCPCFGHWPLHLPSSPRQKRGLGLGFLPLLNSAHASFRKLVSFSLSMFPCSVLSSLSPLLLPSFLTLSSSLTQAAKGVSPAGFPAAAHPSSNPPLHCCWNDGSKFKCFHPPVF